MKSNLKIKIILVLIALGILFVFIPIITTNLNFMPGTINKGSDYKDDSNLNNDNMKASKVSAPIYIDDSDPNYNWAVTKDAGICTGNGTYSEPYIIEDLVIDSGGSGSCIWIENSNVYFKIENCRLYNAVDYPNAGIRLYNVNKGKLVTNNCTSSCYGINIDGYSNNNTISGNTAYDNQLGINIDGYSNNNTISGNTANDNRYGIYIEGYSNNNTISGNTANSNDKRGIEILDSDYNTISGNTANNNIEFGIDLWDSDYNTFSANTANYNEYGIYIHVCNDITIVQNTANYNQYGIYIDGYSNNTVISGNIMNECGLWVGSIPYSYIDSTNLVNGKPLYFYMNEVNLKPNNFTNAGQVILFNCSDSLISKLNVSHSSTGIILFSCNNNSISGNTANYNVGYGIYLSGGGYNDISGNIVNVGRYGILLSHSNNNEISGNTANDNKRSGIHLIDSNYNDILGNTANNNDQCGIYLGLSNYNTVSGNILLGNCKCICESGCKGNVFENNDCGIPFEFLIILISSISGGAVIGVVIFLLIKRKRRRLP